MGFEVYVKGSAPVASVPAVTVQKKGIISLNDSAFQLIDSPEAVELLWDPDRKAIAIRPSELANFNAYPTRRMQIKSGRRRGRRPARRSQLVKTPFLEAATVYGSRTGTTRQNVAR